MKKDQGIIHRDEWYIIELICPLDLLPFSNNNLSIASIRSITILQSCNFPIRILNVRIRILNLNVPIRWEILLDRDPNLNSQTYFSKSPFDYRSCRRLTFQSKSKQSKCNSFNFNFPINNSNINNYNRRRKKRRTGEYSKARN